MDTVGLLADGYRRTIVAMGLVVVLLHLEAVLLIMALPMDKVVMVIMERLIIMDIVDIVTMVVMVLMMDTGFKAEVEEVRHTPHLVAEAGLGSCICTMLDFV